MTSLLSLNEQKPFSWKSFWLYYLFFFYFSGVYQIIIFSSGLAGGTGLRQAIYMSFLWLIPLLIIPRYSKIISAFTGLLLWASSLVTMGYFALYGQDFSQSVLFILFESNLSEGSEFLESYFSWWMIPALIAYSLAPLFLWTKTKPINGSIKIRQALALSLSLIIAWPVFNSLILNQAGLDRAISKQINRMEPSAPWHLVMGYVKYKQQLNEIEKNLLLNETLPPLKKLVDKNADTPNTLVLVIGESTNRQRMSLYGYDRDTTPNLNAMREEFLVFENVYATRPYTIEALEQVLTFADARNPNLYMEKPTLINLMKQAGYKTYWITNQQTQTKRNTMLTTFSKQADEQIYLNNNRMQDAAQYDGVVIKPFEKILNDSTRKKFIVIHLLGTHRKYHYRYPDNFDIYNASDLAKWLSNKQTQEYNEYDNAIRYNDHVVANIIQRFKASEDNGLLVYFSDHGEEVYDDPKHLFAGRNEGAPTSPMYTIPFIVWRSDSWKKQNDLMDTQEMVHRRYSSSDFIYTWSDLAGINFEGFDATRSLVNHDFSNHPIWIGDPDNPKKLRDLQTQPFADEKQAVHIVKDTKDLKQYNSVN